MSDLDLLLVGANGLTLLAVLLSTAAPVLLASFVAWISDLARAPRPQIGLRHSGPGALPASDEAHDAAPEPTLAR